MSLIIAYVGKKGCVMASDKRRIAYFGTNRQALEDELYNGNILYYFYPVNNKAQCAKWALIVDEVVKLSEQNE